MVERITLYSAYVCPSAHRVEIALKEAGLEHKRYEIDLANKPEWYTPKVNPASKVPAMAYGGPDVDPATPSPDSVKLAESLVLIEFVNDLVADAKPPLLPKDPVKRAQARFFIETFQSKFVAAYYASIGMGEDPVSMIPALDAVQGLLPKDEKAYAVGEFSLADIAVIPFLARTFVTLKNDIGAYDVGQGKAFYERIQTDPKYERLRKYYDLVTSRESFKSTFREDMMIEGFRKGTELVRAGRAAGKA